MGTSADFYIGNEFIGQLGMDGYPEGVPTAVRRAKTPKAFRQAVMDAITSGRSAYLPSAPWSDDRCAVRSISPVRSERATASSHYTYVFDKGHVKATNKDAHGWFDPAKREPKWSREGEYAEREGVNVLARLNALSSTAETELAVRSEQDRMASPGATAGVVAVSVLGLGLLGSAVYLALSKPAAAAPSTPSPLAPAPAPKPGGSAKPPVAPAPTPAPKSTAAPRVPTPAQAAPQAFPGGNAGTGGVQSLTTSPQGGMGMAAAHPVTGVPQAPAPAPTAPPGVDPESYAAPNHDEVVLSQTATPAPADEEPSFIDKLIG